VSVGGASCNPRSWCALCHPAHPDCRCRRPANKDARIAGLYFAGASTRPGNGVPLCFIGAKLTAERVLKDLRRG
jgi:phytoene dehydrogenase-like protein